MAHEPRELTKRTCNDYTVLSTAERLVIRPPRAFWVVAALFPPISVLLPWGMAEFGLLDRAIWSMFPPMLATVLMSFAIILGRWWTLDRKCDSVRYFPWRLCKLTAIRGVRIIERRVGKLRLSRAWTVDLDLEGGSQVRFAGFWHSRLGLEQAMAMATLIGEWLNIPITQEHLRPVA
jgi:hypothetical protein